MISRARFSLRPRWRFSPARDSGPSDCWLSRKNSIAGCCSTASNISPNRPSTWGRIASRSNQPALVGGDEKMIGPERHQPLGKSAIDDDSALQPRQRFAAEGFLDDVQLL